MCWRIINLNHITMSRFATKSSTIIRICPFNFYNYIIVTQQVVSLFTTMFCSVCEEKLLPVYSPENASSCTNITTVYDYDYFRSNDNGVYCYCSVDGWTALIRHHSQKCYSVTENIVLPAEAISIKTGH